MSDPHAMLQCKELAFALRRHVSFVYAMRWRGFQMPGGVASVAMAQAWLVRNPPPKSRKWHRGKSG